MTLYNYLATETINMNSSENLKRQLRKIRFKRLTAAKLEQTRLVNQFLNVWSINIYTTIKQIINVNWNEIFNTNIQCLNS